ncbi:hypothetical protein [Stenomitos frigidus]|uniref:Uncharacterized protein n=1 Tax=Stenomitos frigidus ULC18 TaxID=2107698 RepID=A0A2T1ESS0_9CYAN|nr:hypothetical protein [Stenomitos frigidus]PSB35779.1 hypothetical protein C7B82_00175 [Stenomitos frigidus ULC18]
MVYLERLQPWCIIRLLPNMQHLVVVRLRRRHEAEAYLKSLRWLNPTIGYEIVFDLPGSPQTDLQRQSQAISNPTKPIE